MKEIKLLKHELQNFQGGNFTLEPYGEDVGIYAKNGIGKTRLFSGYTWILTDNDSMGRPTFEVKNMHLDGTYDLEASVLSTFLVDGVEIELQKTFREIWSGARGKAEKVMTGNENIYRINGQVKSATEYRALLKEIMADQEILSLIVNPSGFALMPNKKDMPAWRRQRSILIDIVGDVSNEQIIESDADLFPLVELLKRFTVSKNPVGDLKAVSKSSRLETAKEIEKIPIAIKENVRMMPDIKGLNRADCETKVQNCEHFLNEAKLRLSGIDNGGKITELSKRLAGINADIQALETTYTNDAMKAVNRLNQQIGELNDKKEAHERKSRTLSNELVLKKNSLQGIEDKLSRLRERWTTIDAESFVDTVNDTCPACGQSLPSERVQEARDKALAAFNQSKAERLTDIEKEGKGYAGQKETILKEIESLQRELLELPAFETAYNMADLEAERDNLKKKAEDYNLIIGYQELIGQKHGLEVAIKSAKESVSFDRDGIHAEIADLQTKLIEAKAKADMFTEREKREVRVQELMAEEKKLAKEIEKLEQIITRCDLFTRKKVALLDERIQAKFKYVQFRLFKENIGNDGVEECCDILVDGVPYNAGLNTGARKGADLEMCNVLQEHYGIRAPIFVDDAEKFTSPITMNCQTITLVASKGMWVENADGTKTFIPDDKLRIEKSEKARKAA
jgi:hypothetical protein